MRALVLGLLAALVFAGSFWFFASRGDEIVEFVADRADRLRVPVQKALGHEPRPSRIIYLNREGATLGPGSDDARKNRSSIIEMRGLATHTLDAFGGSKKTFESIAACVAENFAAYDVQVVTSRPVTDDYMMVMLGDRAGPLDDGKLHEGKHLYGLSPATRGPIERAIVYVFATELRNHVKHTCETTSHEIAHAYGLDHTRECSDLMSYEKPCKTRRVFADKDVPCGEDEDRNCDRGTATQNSHQLLLGLLGPRPTAATAP